MVEPVCRTNFAPCAAVEVFALDGPIEFRLKQLYLTRWLGIKVRLDFENILDIEESRERTVFTGRRDLSSLRSLEYRDDTRGRQLYLTFSGTY